MKARKRRETLVDGLGLLAILLVLLDYLRPALLLLPTVTAGGDTPCHVPTAAWLDGRSEEHTSELQSHSDLVCRLLLEKKKNTPATHVALSPPASTAPKSHVSN